METEALNPATFRNTWLDQKFEWFKDKSIELKKSVAEARLNRELANVLKYAEAVRINGGSQGDARFRSALAKADQAIMEFCRRFGGEPEDIYRKWPGFESVRQLAQQPSRPPTLVIVIGGLCVIVALTIVTGLLGGLLSRMYHLIAP